MVVWLRNAADPSPSAQVDVAPLMAGVDTDIRGIKKNTEPSGALSRHCVSRTGAFVGCQCPYRSRIKLNRQAQCQDHAGEAALPPRPRVALSI